MAAVEAYEMNTTQKPSEAVKAAVLLLATYVVTVVAVYFFFFMLPAIEKYHWPGSRAAVQLIVYGPFVPMLFPGTRQVARQHWVSGTLLIIAGGVMGRSVAFVVTAIAWMTL